ncbi:MAG: DUF4340 domain-containing protein [Oscillatoria sp. SIO1A7]|nr:DUF4340 domain-containing protein [Oscillatoria sp. SIO1A7]
MRLQRSTIIIFFLALSMVGGVYYYETEVIPQQEAEKDEKQQLFAFNEDDVEFLTVKNQEQTLRFKRSPESAKPQPGDTIWRMEIVEYVPPIEESIDEESIDYEESTPSENPNSGNFGETDPSDNSGNIGELTPSEQPENPWETASSEERENPWETAPSEESGNSEGTPGEKSGDPETTQGEESASSEELTPRENLVNSGQLALNEELANIGELNPSEESENSEDSENTLESESLEELEKLVGTEVPANDAYVSFLLSELVKAKSERSFVASEDRLKDYGLEEPIATVEVSLKDGQTHELVVGKRDFTEKSLYARVDPSEAEAEKPEVVLVSLNFDYGVNRSLKEWKQLEETLGDLSDEAVEASTEDAAEESGEKQDEDNSLDTFDEPAEENSAENSAEDSEASYEDGDGESPEEPAAVPGSQ